MSLFFILAALMVVAALAFIIPSTLKRSSQDELDQLDTNISIAKDRRSQLQQSLQSGTIDQATYDSELIDLEHGLAADVGAAEKHRESAKRGIGIAASIALFLPIASGALYLQLGEPAAVDTDAMHAQVLQNQQQQQQAGQPPALAELLPNLERKLLENPNDIDGWKLLGKSYLTISDFSNAKRALLRAYEIDNADPDLLSQLAEATAMERGGDLSGEASEYLDSALQINPQHQQSLWLVAISRQQAGKHEEAITRFEALRSGVADNPDAVASVNEMINLSRIELGLDAVSSQLTTTAEGSTANAEPTTNDAPTSTSGAAEVSVTVSLADGVLEQVNASDSVFIFARASSGPPMPLAVSRHVVSDLPITVVLNDSMAMMPAMTLSQFPSVTVAARISASGDAIAQPGDWFGELENIQPAESPKLELVIDTLNE